MNIWPSDRVGHPNNPCPDSLMAFYGQHYLTDKRNLIGGNNNGKTCQ